MSNRGKDTGLALTPKCPSRSKMCPKQRYFPCLAQSTSTGPAMRLGCVAAPPSPQMMPPLVGDTATSAPDSQVTSGYMALLPVASLPVVRTARCLSPVMLKPSCLNHALTTVLCRLASVIFPMQCYCCVSKCRRMAALTNSGSSWPWPWAASASRSYSEVSSPDQIISRRRSCRIATWV